MPADQYPSSFEIKLTIAREECPGVHEALSPIHDPKRRARRLRDLAAKGLLLEAYGLATASSPSNKQSPPTPAPTAAMPQSAAATPLGGALDWDEEAN
jgi:hypothetical protein